MVVRFRKKLRRQRGNRWHGYGSKKKHRGKGSKGGKGFSGFHKHKWSYTTKMAHGVFGTKGFVSIQQKKGVGKVINLDDLDKLAKKLGKTEIDLGEMGYVKLLSRGIVTKPISVKVAKFSATAKEKLEKAGGKILE